MLFRTKLAEFHCIPDVTDFVLVAIHTSPSKAPQEINELANVYDDVIKRLSSARNKTVALQLKWPSPSKKIVEMQKFATIET